MNKCASPLFRLLTFLLLTGWLAFFLLAPPPVGSDEAVGPPGAAQTAVSEASTEPAPAPAQEASSEVSAVTQAAVKAGVLSAASRINQVVTFLTAKTQSSAYLFIPQKQPDRSLFSVSLGLEGEGAQGYASASFAPTVGGQVAAVYDTVQYLPESCAAVESGTFKNLKRKGTLGKDIVILDGGSTTIFLMPAGTGCVVIRKEVVQ